MSDLIPYHPSIQRIINNIGKTTVERAKQMYLGNVLPTDISEFLEIDITELGYLCFGLDRSGEHPNSWFHIKKTHPISSVYTYSVVKPVVLKQSEMMLVNLISNNLTRMTEEKKDLDMDELSKAAGMVEKLDKIVRLEEGKITENVEITAGFSLREIANGKKLDDVDNKSDSDNDSIEAEYSPLNNPGD